MRVQTQRVGTVADAVHKGKRGRKLGGNSQHLCQFGGGRGEEPSVVIGDLHRKQEECAWMNGR